MIRFSSFLIFRFLVFLFLDFSNFRLFDSLFGRLFDFWTFASAEVWLSCSPKWPGYSPDFNLAENVWAWAEGTLRDDEKDRDSFEVFSKAGPSGV